jgi:putative FmdB family regulatory protein
MPLYEYQCDACGHRFEKIQKFSDPPAEVCPKCGGAVRKLLSSPAIQFKGSGWYITDYPKSGQTRPSDGPTSSETPAADTSPKTDAKTETTSTSSSSSTESKATPAAPAAPAKTDK